MTPGKPLAMPGDATPATRTLQQAVLATLPLADRRMFDEARDGLIAEWGERPVMDVGGRTIWSLAGFSFLNGDAAPDTVHPALWRLACCNMANGLFKVTDRIYQVRGLDISNMTIIEGDTGLVVIDALTCVEVARAALALYYEHRPQRPVVALIYTHTHVDHFGGARGVVDESDVQAGRVAVYAPAGFVEEAVSENVTAGPAMLRRAHFQFGPMLRPGPRTLVDAGLGKGVSRGTVSLVAPTVVIREPVERHRIDGVECEFVLTPGAEAPAEMIVWHPGFRVLNMAEIACHTMHNLLPLRGAQVRDALLWSKHIAGALDRFGDMAEVVVAQHHWPVRGRARIAEFLGHQRDLYRYLHDQTVRRMNHGQTAREIAEDLRLPPALDADWSARAFYGGLKHNVKAVVQRYLGWYDGHPAHLDPLPPVAEARKLVEYMGGAAAILARARGDYARGEYRWVADIASKVVFAEPGNLEARTLAADALEQLGYQNESSTMRNAYLQGAAELRNGPPRMPVGMAQRLDVVRAMSLAMVFDQMAVRLDAGRAHGRHMRLDWQFTDTGETVAMELVNGVLHAGIGRVHVTSDAAYELARTTLDDVLLGAMSFGQAVDNGRILARGEVQLLGELEAMLDQFPNGFPIMEPGSRWSNGVLK